MKEILNRKISKVGGNIIMVISIIMAGLAPIICQNVIEVIEMFILTIGVGVEIGLVDIAIQEEMKTHKKNEDQYVSGTVNLNW